MNGRRWVVSVIGVGCCVLAAAGAGESSATQPATRPEALGQLLGRLGDDDYAVREEATRALFGLDASILPRLRKRLATERDPEVRRRLRFVIENLRVPHEAVLVVRASAGCGLEPGDVITHVGTRRVRSQAELRRRLLEPGRRVMLRVRGVDGPRTVGPIGQSQLEALADFVMPRGPRVAQVVRLYAGGFVEQAWALLRDAGGSIPENELSTPLLLRIAYTAGAGEGTFDLLAARANLVRATGEDWTSPSFFDLAGPGKAPFHLEWLAAKSLRRQAYATQNDPDLRIQRILMPARRRIDALVAAAGYWRMLFEHARQSDANAIHVAGNELAVVAWMLYALDLRSECCRLIEPRSIILRRPETAIHKWVRVETDAWLPLFAGDARGAVAGFYDDALAILQRPPKPDDRAGLIRNPQVAARLALFLYQLPNDKRIAQALDAVNQPGHPALAAYLDWMLLAVDENNQAVVRRDLQAAFPNVPDDRAAETALGVALLEYVQARPEAEVFRAAGVRAAAAGDPSRAATIDVLGLLAAGRPAEALERLTTHADGVGLAVLRHTAAFLADPPPAAAGRKSLADVLLAVPLGSGGGRWVVLTRAHRLLRFDAATGSVEGLASPAPNWFPGPRSWPWLGRDEHSGRVWVYGRRRVMEVPLGEGVPPVRLNIRTEDIAAFDRYVGPHFAALAEALADTPAPVGETGEFLRAEVRAHAGLCADPDLPEIGLIRCLPRAPRFVQVALRGGAHLLIDTAGGRAWTSRWLAEAAGLERPPTYWAQAVAAGDGLVVMLLSDQGVLRFEPATGRVRRIALPGASPYPVVIPESTPYERRDPRWVYVARLPKDGGQVYRITLADDSVEKVDMINEALPDGYYAMFTRGELRRRVDARLRSEGGSSLEALVRDAIKNTRAWQKAADVR